MPTKKKVDQKKKPVSPKKKQARGVETKKKSSPIHRFLEWRKSLQPRTPHKSFRRTYQRDYVRPLELPGYLGFTIEVWRTLWRYRATFSVLIAMYAVLSGALVGLASQSMYSQLSELLRSTGGEIFQGNAGKVGEAGILLVTGLSGGINANLTEAQQLMSIILILFTWLTTVWLLRAFLAGHTPRFRDGLYNSGAPVVPTFLLSLLLLVQLIPAAIAAIGISAATPTGLINQGIEAMLFWTVVLLLMVLSVYFITGTLFALIVVTLPGMYPLRALKTANELVIGRRVRIMLRILWVGATILVALALTLIPIILFDAWLKGMFPAIEWLPIVPVALLLASSASVVWLATYIYLLYRKVVDDDSAPA